MLSGSEKEPDGGERKGGGKGRGARLAKRETPVSKRNGCCVCGSDFCSEESAWDGGGGVVVDVVVAVDRQAVLLGRYRCGHDADDAP